LFSRTCCPLSTKGARDRGFEVVAVGTGQALGHGPPGRRRHPLLRSQIQNRPKKKVSSPRGFGLERRAVMYNDLRFWSGPASDPAGVKGKDIVAAPVETGRVQRRFSSRAATKSGTALGPKMRYWKSVGLEPAAAKERGQALRTIASAGAVWGPALNIASSSDGIPAPPIAATLALVPRTAAISRCWFERAIRVLFQSVRRDRGQHRRSIHTPRTEPRARPFSRLGRVPARRPQTHASRPTRSGGEPTLSFRTPLR